MAPLVWCVTGATGGLGMTLVSRIIARGDYVVATGRRAEDRLADLYRDNDLVRVIDLDLSADREAINIQVKKAWEAFGRIDVLVNNAGLSAPQAIEEASDEFTNTMFTTNLFGPLRVTQALLPYLRSLDPSPATIAFIGAGVAWGPIPFLAHYTAAKAALNGLVEGLRKELRSQGNTHIRCTILEPGGFASSLGHPREGSDMGFGRYSPALDGYAGLFGETMGVFANEIGPNVPGDVERMAGAIVGLLAGGQGDSGMVLPVRVVLGSDAVAVVRQKCQEQLKLLDEYEEVGKSSDRDGAEALDLGATLRLTSMMG